MQEKHFYLHLWPILNQAVRGTSQEQVRLHMTDRVTNFQIMLEK